jgi:probable rRNA maturation factor
VQSLVKKILSDLDSRRKFKHPFPLAPVTITKDKVLQPLALSIAFVDDQAIQSLNKSFRGKDKPTDVLSFSQLEGGPEGFSANSPVLPFTLPLGDIIISLDTAERQALQHNTTFDEEILRLLIHGVLHLFGYDHDNVPEEDAIEMEAEEKVMFDVWRESLDTLQRVT